MTAHNPNPRTLAEWKRGCPVCGLKADQHPMDTDHGIVWLADMDRSTTDAIVYAAELVNAIGYFVATGGRAALPHVAHIEASLRSAAERRGD